MEDIRIMRKTTARQVNFQTGTATSPTLVVPRNYHRVALVLPNLYDAGACWQLGPQPANLNYGFFGGDDEAAVAAWLTLDIQHHGALVFGPWYIFRSVGGGIVGCYFETELTQE